MIQVKSEMASRIDLETVTREQLSMLMTVLALDNWRVNSKYLDEAEEFFAEIVIPEDIPEP